ncbi:hypothetical protein [Clostridium sp.]|uniref:hypothetical protein n=1 Tax=Clostridium sp. TaxID=1506 RepID=UPI002FCA2271
MVDANKTAQHTQSIKNLIHQFRHDAALDTKEAEVAQNASAQLKAQNLYEAALNDKYRSLYTPEMQTKHGTFETFLANHDPRGVANIRNMYQTDSVIDQYNAGRSHL